MRSIIVFLIAILALSSPAGVMAADRKRAEKCQKIDQQIRKIEARMRRGYTAAQGVRLDERLRELREERYRLCR